MNPPKKVIHKNLNIRQGMTQLSDPAKMIAVEMMGGSDLLGQQDKGRQGEGVWGVRGGGQTR